MYEYHIRTFAYTKCILDQQFLDLCFIMPTNNGQFLKLFSLKYNIRWQSKVRIVAEQQKQQQQHQHQQQQQQKQQQQ